MTAPGDYRAQAGRLDRRAMAYRAAGLSAAARDAEMAAASLYAAANALERLNEKVAA